MEGEVTKLLKEISKREHLESRRNRSFLESFARLWYVHSSENATGEKEDAIVIWESETSKESKEEASCGIFQPAKGWMTGEILDTVLSKVNQWLRSKGCSIALLLDNAECHPPDMKNKCSNINIIFVPF